MISFTQGSDISDCGQYEVGPGDTPVRRSVTLRANDSINLTTGVVTRSDQRSEIISFPTGLVAALRRNNLRALHLAIIDDALRPWEQEMINGVVQPCHLQGLPHTDHMCSNPRPVPCKYCSDPVHLGPCNT